MKGERFVYEQKPINMKYDKRAYSLQEILKQKIKREKAAKMWKLKWKKKRKIKTEAKIYLFMHINAM